MAEWGQVVAGVDLQERSEILSALLDAFRAARTCTPGPAAVLLTGPAGCGTTSVLEAFRDLVEREGAAVLHAACSPLEVRFPFAVVQQLLGADAAEATDDEQLSVLDRLHRALVARAAGGPVVLLVDGVQWADDPSLRWLHFVLRRLGGVSVLPVLTARPCAARRPLVAALRALPAVCEVPVPPLSVEAVGRVLRGSGDGVSDDLVACCHAATGGSPVYLHALAAALRDEGTERVAAALAGSAAPVSEVVSRVVLDRLRALGEDALEVVRAVSVLGQDARQDAVVALAGLPEARVAAALEAARDAGFLLPTSQPRVEHPVVVDVVHRQLPAAQRTRLHREAARRLVAGGADPERAALQLLHTEPGDDIWVVESLLAGARSAVRRGAPETAARYLRRALAEPLARRSPALLLELGRAELLAGELGAAHPLRDAMQLAADDETLSTATILLARCLAHGGDAPQAVEALRAAQRRLRDTHSELALRLELEVLDLAHLDARTIGHADALSWGTAPWAEADGRDRLVLAHLSLDAARSGRSVEEALALARQALDDDGLLAEHGPEACAPYLPIIALLVSDGLDEARAHLDAAVRQSRARASVPGFCLAAAARSHAALRAGDVPAAGTDAEASLAAAVAAGLRTVVPYAVSFLSDVLVERGELAAADRLWREHDLEGALPMVLASNCALFSRGSLRLAQARTTEGVRDLLESGERQRLWGTEGVGFWPWASRAALGLHALGEHERARALVDQELDGARAFGAARPLGMALHAAALLERGQARLQGLERAREALAGAPAPLEHARVLVDLGAALLRQARRTQGLGTVEDGLRRAVACGATALSARARAELVAAGIAPRRAALDGVEALTVSERRVAQLAAEGGTNREIAQALFVTPKTVETHLARAFRKLGISSRRELAALAGLGGSGRSLECRS